MSEVSPGAGAAPFAAANLSGGVVLAGRYRLERSLGSGGMAEVWRALDLATQRVVALKLLRAQVAASSEAMQRLKREGEVLTALSHPAIVRVESVGQLEGGAVFLAMELLEGETLGARMRRGVMQPAELAPIVTGTCAGLTAAHAKGIVHRDLKPDNVFLVPVPGGELQVKLLDFGVSKVYGGDRLTYTGEVLGTPRYMSPEQLGAEPDVDPRIDIYALGVILYEALSGKPPFLAGTPTDLIVAILHGKVAPLRTMRPELSPALEAVIMRAMARAREARYRTAADLAEAFLDAVGATGRARALPKKVLRTEALGGAGQAGGSLPPAGLAGAGGAEAGAASEALRPGTFSAFGAVDEAEVRASAVPRTIAMDAVGPEFAPTVPSFAPAARTAASGPSAAPSSGIAVGGRTASGIAPAAPSAAVESWGEHPQPDAWIPPRSPLVGRVLLVLAGLLAGALSAGIAVAALHYFDAGHDAQETPAVAPAPPMSTRAPSGEGAPAPPSAPAPDDGTAATAPTAPEPPSSDEAALPVAPDPPEPSSERSRRRERTARARPDAPSEAERPPPSDPLEAASRALADGDAARCIEILEGLMERGATPFAIKRLADCELRAGRARDAVRDYQRFCRLAPDHPAIPSAREQLAELGLSCP